MVKDKKRSDREGFEEDIDLELSLGPSYLRRKNIRSSSSPPNNITMPPPVPSVGYGFRDIGDGAAGIGNSYGGGGGGGIVPPVNHGGGGFSIPNHPGSGGGRRHSRVRVRAETAVDLAVPPFEWATNRFAKIHGRDHLISKGIHTITGEVQCKKCEHRCSLEYDLQSKLLEVGSFIYHNKEDLCHRATDNWMTPRLETCPRCDQPNSLKPVMPSDKGLINWLFLLLGQMIGCCTLEQLKFYCDKNSLHRTGAKDRLIFLTYLSLCKQLDPTGPFELDGC
ncbi:hypothetical protein C5167_033922 [Papaver somniferum]|uniref:DUF7086 domain-containing protein n=1 Tax=Papaver somniferum TaxID=3469 RepID=A0A4Y7KBQ2_PAPSO|nr:uncharacterized protein LOC113295463 [Papaver somniferum]RZC70793.1 hypothetical protein C5167_033922 [Papaver somniferum]